MSRRLSDEEVEQRMIKKISAAIYPVLIPLEPQSCEIQAENKAIIDAVAKLTWRDFKRLCE